MGEDTEMSDYIDLGPDDVIREGDEHLCPITNRWKPAYQILIGKPVEDITARRPRSVVIRDAAIDLLRQIVAMELGLGYASEALREAIGISVEELRGEA